MVSLYPLGRFHSTGGPWGPHQSVMKSHTFRHAALLCNTPQRYSLTNGGEQKTHTHEPLAPTQGLRCISERADWLPTGTPTRDHERVRRGTWGIPRQTGDIPSCDSVQKGQTGTSP